MHFQVRTDNHIHNNETITDGIRAEVEAAIGDRFGDRIRRVEVYLQDMNAQKGGIDIRCSIEVSLAGHQPIAVHDVAAGVDDAVTGAVDKMTPHHRTHSRPDRRPQRPRLDVGRGDLIRPGLPGRGSGSRPAAPPNSNCS